MFNFYAGEDANLPELADFIVTAQTMGSSRVNDIQNDEVSFSLLKTIFLAIPFLFIFDSELISHLQSPSFPRFTSYIYIYLNNAYIFFIISLYEENIVHGRNK